ncbi:DDE-type integrase/transposase/recombinase, partial [Vibrio parahaemolyticus]|nr:DDE-type integrase/transposase/recombinase [Vibrio parahaemolyticus]
LCGVLNSYHRPRTFNTDKDRAYISAIEALSTEELPLQHRRIKYQNNRIESDHGKLKRLINAVRGF